MKKILKSFIFAGVGMLTLASCSDFLDQTSPSEMTAEAVFNSESSTEETIALIYSGMVLDHTYGCRIPLNYATNTDCELIDAITEETTGNANERGLGNYMPSSGWNRLPSNWSSMYAMIENANIAIEGINGSKIKNNTKMKYYLGEALTIRAMVYYDLIKNYGDVPMKMEAAKSDGSNIYVPKTDRDVIMDQLLKDLQQAAELLPWAGQAGYTSERVTKGFALGLAARIALAEAGYSIRESRKDGYVDLSEKKEGQLGFSDATYPTMRPGDAKRTELYQLALTCLNTIIAEGPHKLNPSFDDEWTLSNQLKLDQTYYENLYEVAHGLNMSGEMGYTVGVRMAAESTHFGYTNSSGKVKIPAPFFYSYDPQDSRRDVTCAPYELKDKTSTQTFTNNPFNGIYVAKWDVRKMTESWLAMNKAVKQKTGYGINWIVMRYSDVLLMYAEVVNELYGPNGAGACGKTAKDALKEVRARAFAKASAADQATLVTAYADAAAVSKTAFFNAIVDERAWELAGEAIRKYDLIRWGLLIDKSVEMLDKYRNAIANDEYPSKLYYKEDPTAQEWYKIDYSSVCWYAEPSDPSAYKSASWLGGVKKNGVIDDTNANYAALNFLFRGLIKYDKYTGFQGTNGVVNRHLIPIGTTTITNSNGTLSNSYGF